MIFFFFLSHWLFISINKIDYWGFGVGKNFFFSSFFAFHFCCLNWFQFYTYRKKNIDSRGLEFLFHSFFNTVVDILLYSINRFVVVVAVAVLVDRSANNKIGLTILINLIINFQGFDECRWQQRISSISTTGFSFFLFFLEHLSIHLNDQKNLSVLSHSVFVFCLLPNFNLFPILVDNDNYDNNKFESNYRIKFSYWKKDSGTKLRIQIKQWEKIGFYTMN